MAGRVRGQANNLNIFPRRSQVILYKHMDAMVILPCAIWPEPASFSQVGMRSCGAAGILMQKTIARCKANQGICKLDVRSGSRARRA